MKKEKLTLKNNVEIEIPVKGSLGILAYGAVGIKAWREVRIKKHKQNETGEKHTEKS